MEVLATIGRERMSVRHWQPGDSVILRFLTTPRAIRYGQTIHDDSLVMMHGWPHVVVKDTDELIVLYRPEGNLNLSWDVLEQRFLEPPATVPRGYALRLLFPGKAYDVTLFYDAGNGVSPFIESYFGAGEGHFRGWKVDLVTPVRRSEFGYDTVDEVLDILVSPDRSYQWKDEDQMALLMRKGVYTLEEAGQIRKAGREVIKLIESAKSPFDDEWTDWQPSPELALRDIPHGWQFWRP